jgi:hypothetical protein
LGLTRGIRARRIMLINDTTGWGRTGPNQTSVMRDRLTRTLEGLRGTHCNEVFDGQGFGIDGLKTTSQNLSFYDLRGADANLLQGQVAPGVFGISSAMTPLSEIGASSPASAIALTLVQGGVPNAGGLSVLPIVLLKSSFFDASLEWQDFTLVHELLHYQFQKGHLNPADPFNANNIEDTLGIKPTALGGDALTTWLQNGCQN